MSIFGFRINYRALLKKYMDHVGDCEGTDFTGMSMERSDLLTDKEKSLLRAISDERRDDARKRS